MLSEELHLKDVYADDRTTTTSSDTVSHPYQVHASCRDLEEGKKEQDEKDEDEAPSAVLAESVKEDTDTIDDRGKLNLI